MERRRFARYSVLLALPPLAGCNEAQSNRETTPGDETTTNEETTRTDEVVYKLSGKVVDEAPMGVDPSPYPEPEYENPYLTKVIEKAIEAPNGKEVFVEVPKEDAPDVNEDRAKLNSGDQGVYAEYKGHIVRIRLIKYE